MPVKHISFLLLASIILLAGIEGASFLVRFATGAYLSSTVAQLHAERDRQSLLDRLEAKGRVVDRRTAAEAIRQAAALGREVLPKLVLEDVFHFSGEKLLPLSGVPNRTIITGPDAGRWILLDHDMHGFNNDRAAWENSADLVVFGASTIYGWGVEREKNFVSLLGRRTGFNTINFGYPGPASPHRYAAIIREYFGNLKAPKIILWSLWDNMEFSISDSPAQAAVDRYKDPGYRQGLATRQTELEADYIKAIKPATSSGHYQFLPTGPERSHLMDILLMRNTRLILARLHSLIAPPPPAQAPTDPKTRPCQADLVANHMAWLDVALRDLEGGKITIVATYLPFRQRLDGIHSGNDFCYNDLVTAFRSRNIPVIDLVEGTTKAGLSADDLFDTGSSNHYSEAGHAIVADMIANGLAGLGLVAPPRP